MTASWSEVSAPHVKDWLGLYDVGAGQYEFLAWRRITEVARGNEPFTIPANLPGGGVGAAHPAKRVGLSRLQ